MGELDSTYGAVLIGVFVSAILFGVTNLQVFVYFKQCSHDILWNKFAVCWLWCLDSVHLTLCFHMVYWYLITNYADPDALFHVIWSFKAQIILDAIVVVSVHTLYTIRVWKLDAIVHRPSRFRRLSLLLVSFLMLSEYGAAIVLCYEFNRFNAYTDLLREPWITYYPLTAITAVDVTIAACLCYLLARSRTGFRRTDSIITLLMIYILNTGVVTALCSLTAITMMACLPGTFAVLSVEFSLTKLYINSFMAMFNARDAIRADPRWTSDRVVLTSMDPISFDSARDHVGSRPARDLDLVRRAGAAKLPPSAPAPAPAPSPASVFGVDLRYSVRPAHPAAGDNAQERGARAGTERLLADGRASKVLSADLAFVAPTLRRPPGAYAYADLTRPAS